MKVREVDYLDETLQKVMSNPMVYENFNNIKSDFEGCYDGFLSQELPNLTEPQIAQLKTDIFIAYIMGTINASDIRTAFRMGFKIPECTVEKKPLIITGQENQLYKGNNKIII